MVLTTLHPAPLFSKFNPKSSPSLWFSPEVDGHQGQKEHTYIYTIYMQSVYNLLQNSQEMSGQWGAEWFLLSSFIVSSGFLASLSSQTAMQSGNFGSQVIQMVGSRGGSRTAARCAQMSCTSMAVATLQICSVKRSVPHPKIASSKPLSEHRAAATEKKQRQQSSQQICPGDRQTPNCDLPHVKVRYPSGHRRLLVNQVLVFTRAAACPFKRAGSNSHQQRRDHHTASGEGGTEVFHTLTWLQPFVLQSCFCTHMKRLPQLCSTIGGACKGSQPG